MVTLIILEDSKRPDGMRDGPNEYPEYWTPLICKYENQGIKFLFTNKMEDALYRSRRWGKHKALFITRSDAIPAYDTMVELENLNNECILLPTDRETGKQVGIGLNPKKAHETLAKDWSLENYIDTWTPLAIQKGTMYCV